MTDQQLAEARVAFEALALNRRLDPFDAYLAATERMLGVVAERDAEIARLEALVYVPGVWRCAKCKLSLVSTTMCANTGRFAANSEPHQCPNGCGPMWHKTERDAGNELIDTMDRMADRLADLEQKLSAAQKDAQRYRWMTENYGLEVDGPKSWKFYTLIPWRPRTSDKAELDAAIDAAITAAKEGSP